MENSPTLCEQCGVGKFETEYCGLEATKTCTSCGYTCSNVELRAPTGNESGYTYTKTVSLCKKYSVGDNSCGVAKRRLNVIEQMRAYLEEYPRNLHLQESAEQLFLDSLKGVRPKKCATYGAAAVVIVLREADQSVFLNEVANFFLVSTKEMTRKMLYIKGNCKRSIPSASIEHFISKYLNDSTGIVDKDAVNRLALELCTLFSKMNICTAPKTTALLALYNATIAHKGKIPAMTIRAFFKLTPLKVPFAGFEKSSLLLKDKFIILAKRLPWASTVTVRNYHIYIPAILKHQSLIFDNDLNVMTSKVMSESSVASMQTENSEITENMPLGDPNLLTDQMRLELPGILIKRVLNPEVVAPEEPDPSPVSSSEILVESDCPDTELKEYIRSDEEMAVYMKIMNRTT